MTIIRLLLSAVLLAAPASFAQRTLFSGDSAYAVLNVLVNEIGPRPMGSPAERRALEYAVAKFAQHGCQEAYVMPMTVAEGVNTASGIAIGLLKGKTDRIILIGGHIDSSGPEVPGANDDGSGAATVIELSRVLGKTTHESTVVFCCWGGEEEGLRGSEYFVKTFPRLNDVSLMLQIDMADGSGTLDADPDGSWQVSAPRWLVSAAFDIYYHELGYEGLIYPTQSATINSSTSGSTGSDHMPFLNAGIPAIDFTSDVTYPIHTPLDNWKNFNPSGLARSGDLVLKLAERFDGGVPSRDTDSYLLVVVGGVPVFFSHTILRIGAIASVVAAIIVFVMLRRRRLPPPAEGRIRWSGLKLLLVTLIVQVFIWVSGEIVGVIKGYRFPWVNNFGGFVVLGILCGLVGVWLSLRLVRRFRLAADPYSYYLRAVILLLLMTAGLSLVNAELGIYPALSLLFLAAALSVRAPFLRALFLLLTPYPMIRLVFIEYLGLFQRLIAVGTPADVPITLLTQASYIVVSTVLSLPFVYAFVAVHRASGVDLFWVKKFSGSGGLIFAGTGAVITAVILLFARVYDDTWQPAVRVQQQYSLGSNSGTVTIASSEFLDGLQLSYGGRDTMVTGRVTRMTLDEGPASVVPWLSVHDTTTAEGSGNDSVRTLERRLTLRSHIRPFVVSVTYRSDEPFTIASSWAIGGRRRRERESDRVKTLSWYSFPDTVLEIPVTLTVSDSQRIRESIEVTYDTLAYPVRAQRDLTYFIRRTVVSASGSFTAMSFTR
ncbi:MAG: M28 family metallopeptidase [Bacteroidota bacterium]